MVKCVSQEEECNMRSAPQWLKDAEKISPELRREICRRGGKKSIQKLLIYNDLTREVQRELESRKRSEMFDKLIEANEHLVPIDETTEYFKESHE